MHKRIIITALALLTLNSWAQKERADIRTGNKEYHTGRYPQAEVEYKRALEKSPSSYEANFNLGGALYKQGRHEDATLHYQRIIEDGTNPDDQSKALYNLGNALVKQRKLDEAIESYKSSLRLNPNDTQAKFNLAYAQKLKAEDEKKDDKDKDKDKNQDKNKDQNQDPNQQPNPDNKDKDKDQNKDQQQNQPPPPRPEAERMLKAVQAAEDKTRDKVDKEKVQAVGSGNGKEW